MYAASGDAEKAVNQIVGVANDGIETPEILSVDVEAAVTQRHKSATITGVNLYEALHEGENRVKVTVLAYGLAAPQTVDATITVPQGTPLSGTITATASTTRRAAGSSSDRTYPSDATSSRSSRT